VRRLRARAGGMVLGARASCTGSVGRRRATVHRGGPTTLQVCGTAGWLRGVGGQAAQRAGSAARQASDAIHRGADEAARRRVGRGRRTTLGGGEGARAAAVWDGAADVAHRRHGPVRGGRGQPGRERNGGEQGVQCQGQAAQVVVVIAACDRVHTRC
jgi:hypothetical protein